MISKKSKIFLAGHRGLVGSTIHRSLVTKKFENVLVKTREQLDLCDQKRVFNFLKKQT